MPALRLRLALGLAAALVAASAQAVGLGPLAASGATLSERKGFYLTLINPYPTPERFRLYSLDWDAEAPVERVKIPISEVVLGAKTQRRLLVIATELQPGEEHRFRVCAERKELAAEVLVHARVCSRLVARRVR